jgi:predicted alpha/beta hydrolase family esterase
MSKRVFIIHGWDGYPGEGWFPWLKKELESSGFEVSVPQMPKSEEPRINNWVPAMAEIVGDPDNQTYFIGHSIGCQAISRYLEKLPEGLIVGGVVFVAGFFKRLSHLESDSLTKDISREWLSSPIDLNLVRRHVNKSVAIFSDDDPFVPLDNKEDFTNKLDSKIIIEKGKQHFSGSTGILALPSVLKSILEISGSDKND